MPRRTFKETKFVDTMGINHHINIPDCQDSGICQDSSIDNYPRSDAIGGKVSAFSFSFGLVIVLNRLHNSLSLSHTYTPRLWMSFVK